MSNYTPRRVQIINPSSPGKGAYFKKGQFAYVIGENKLGDMYLVDQARESDRGETAYLVSKTKNVAGGALWFSPEGLRFTGRVRKAGRERLQYGR